MKGFIKAALVAGAFVCVVFASCKKEESEVNRHTHLKRRAGQGIDVMGDHNPKKIKGKIKSSSGGQVIDGADVFLYDQSAPLLVAQTVSDAFGNFEMDSIYVGVYDLKVEASGYQDAEQEITVPLTGEEYDMGDIYLEE